jgi:hypothetical protein
MDARTMIERNWPRAAALLPAVLALVAAAFPSAANADPPSVDTGPATDVSNSGATLNGTLDPNGPHVSYAFRVGLSKGSYTQWTQVQPAGDGRQDVSAHVSGLAADTVYHYLLAATDEGGETVVGEDRTFTTVPLPPLATDATNVTTTSATLNGVAIGGFTATQLSWWFEYGPTADYGSSTDRQPGAKGALAVSAGIGGLSSGIVWHYRLVVANGSGSTPASTDHTFTTARPPAVPPLPTATSLPAQTVTDTAALLQGTIDAAGQTGTYQFEYGTTTSYGASTAAKPLGAGAQSVSAQVDGLRPFTTYHYRLLVVTPAGTVRAADAQLTTRGDILAPNVRIDQPPCGRRTSTACARWRASAAAWRTLSGRASDDANSFASGLDDVRVRIVRHTAKTCRALTRSGFVMRSCALAGRTWLHAWRNQSRWLLNLPRLKPATYQVTVRATDHAGNSIDATLTLHIR